MIDAHNPYAQTYRMARARIGMKKDIKLRLIGKRGRDGKPFNMPTASEVAAIIEGDIDDSGDVRDIVIEKQNGDLKHIHEFDKSYLPLHYPLLFAYGEDGYFTDIPRNKPPGAKRSSLSLKEFLCFRLQDRIREGSQLLKSGRLLQQFMVDAYVMMDTQRLLWIRYNQPALRVETYKNLSDASLRGDTGEASGRRVILPSSYTGGQRWMTQNYQDSLAICKWIGYPSLFITFTCNPKWPEITRFCKKKGVKPDGRPDVLNRVFRLKLNQMIADFKEGKVFGTPKASKLIFKCYLFFNYCFIIYIIFLISMLM